MLKLAQGRGKLSRSEVNRAFKLPDFALELLGVNRETPISKGKKSAFAKLIRAVSQARAHGLITHLVEKEIIHLVKPEGLDRIHGTIQASDPGSNHPSVRTATAHRRALIHAIEMSSKSGATVFEIHRSYSDNPTVRALGLGIEKLTVDRLRSMAAPGKAQGNGK